MYFPLQLQTVLLHDTSVPLFVPDATAVRKAYQEGWISFPYWSQVWPAARALAQCILADTTLVQNKTVIELGAGLGLPSLVAARFAKSILCTDLVPEAVAVSTLSAQQAELQNFKAAVLDWHQLPPALEADVLLLSDVNYEPAVFARLQEIVIAFLEKGTMVLLSTPQRLMAKEFIQPLLPYVSKQEEVVVPHDGKAVLTVVVVLGKPGLKTVQAECGQN